MTALCADVTSCSAMAVNRGHPNTTPNATIARRRSCARDGNGARVSSRISPARSAANASRPMPTKVGSSCSTATRVAGSVKLNASTPRKPRNSAIGADASRATARAGWCSSRGPRGTRASTRAGSAPVRASPSGARRCRGRSRRSVASGECVPSGLTTRLCGSSPLLRSSTVTAPVPTSGRESVSENSRAATETKRGGAGVPGVGVWAGPSRARVRPGSVTGPGPTPSRRSSGPAGGQPARARQDACAASPLPAVAAPCLLAGLGGARLGGRGARAAASPAAASDGQREGGERGRHGHRPEGHQAATSAGRANDEAFGMIESRVHAEPLLEQRAVDAAEVGGVAQVVVVVERREPRELADHLAARLRSDHEARAGRAVVGARAVLVGPAAELAPHVHEHAVLEPARLEVALERAQAVADLEQVRRAGCRPGPSACRSRRSRSRPPSAAGRPRASPRAPAAGRRSCRPGRSRRGGW